MAPPDPAAQTDSPPGHMLCRPPLRAKMGRKKTAARDTWLRQEHESIAAAWEPPFKGLMFVQEDCVLGKGAFGSVTL